MKYDPKTGKFSGEIKIYDSGDYTTVCLKGKWYLAHRLAFFLMTGRWPYPETDHINGDKKDNRWENLRECTQSENQHNSKIPINNTSGVKGVSFDNRVGKWKAYITIKGKQTYLGSFLQKSEAIAARLAAEV